MTNVKCEAVIEKYDIIIKQDGKVLRTIIGNNYQDGRLKGATCEGA